VRAHQLLDDALVNFVAMRVVESGLLTQVVQTQRRTADQAETFTVDWTGLAACYRAEGYAALDLLRRPISVPGRRLVSPTAGAAGALLHRIRVPIMGAVGQPVAGGHDDEWRC
jgi:hypothetical protein